MKGIIYNDDDDDDDDDDDGEDEKGVILLSSINYITRVRGRSGFLLLCSRHSPLDIYIKAGLTEIHRND